MTDEPTDGLHEKYHVEKNGEAIEDCFVLEPETDPAARVALVAYTAATENDSLAADLGDWIAELETEEPL